MAAGFVSPPGSQYGPCPEESDCAHRDCDASRRTARACCLACGEAIGYDTGYFQIYAEVGDAFKGYEHSLCAYQRVEEGSA